MPTPLVNAARAYLRSFEGVTDELIDRHLTGWRGQRKRSLPALYRSLLVSAKNRHSMPNVIGDVDALRDVLFGFDPAKVWRGYDNYAALLGAIKRCKIKTAAPIDATNPRSYWVVYAKAVISSARFLDAFKTARDFHRFVESFYINEYSRLALPLLLKEELAGFGFALACDFLKENGYEGFVKPDTHLKDICRGAGITSSAEDFGVFKDVVSYCNKNGLVPYEFDKLVWLVGSGTFYLSDLRINTNKRGFLEGYVSGG